MNTSARTQHEDKRTFAEQDAAQGGPEYGHDVIENFKIFGSGWKLVRRQIIVCRLQK